MEQNEFRAQLMKFVTDREWEKFHTLENLAKSISIEAGELLELFQWSGAPDSDLVKDELADVLTYAYLLAFKLGEDPIEIMASKLKVTSEKYPIDKAKGRSEKYDRL